MTTELKATSPQVASFASLLTSYVEQSGKTLPEIAEYYVKTIDPRNMNKVPQAEAKIRGWMSGKSIPNERQFLLIMDAIKIEKQSVQHRLLRTARNYALNATSETGIYDDPNTPKTMVEIGLGYHSVKEIDYKPVDVEVARTETQPQKQSAGRAPRSKAALEHDMLVNREYSGFINQLLQHLGVSQDIFVEHMEKQYNRGEAAQGWLDGTARPVARQLDYLNHFFTKHAAIAMPRNYRLPILEYRDQLGKGLNEQEAFTAILPRLGNTMRPYAEDRSRSRGR